MKMRIGRHFTFDAAHKLPDEEIYGKCRNLHGHRYELEVEVEGRIDNKGWVCNFSELKYLVNEYVVEVFDHSNLNDHLEIPTVENMTMKIIDILDKAFEGKDYVLSRIKLYETASCYAEVNLL